MLYMDGNYATAPLPPIAAVYLERFHARERIRATDFDRVPGDPKPFKPVGYERACALEAGAQDRALGAGLKDSHGDQAACLLAMIEELNGVLDGAHGRGGRASVNADEAAALIKVRSAAAQLLRWHFRNGAGALLPIAHDLGIVKGSVA